jgi:2-isopropylmalate synthase
MHDWNRSEPDEWKGVRPRVVDETLRDGLQSPSAHDPPVDRKIAILHAMARIGVDAVSIGLPAAGPRAVQDAVELGREIVDAKLPFQPTAAARTMEGDVRAIAGVAERIGVPIEVYAFIGSSPIRLYTENWELSFLLERARGAGEAARAAGLPFCLVLEDTTRTQPDVLRAMFSAAVDVGAERICLCDTVGHVDPGGAHSLVTFARKTLDELGAPQVELDWHGHNDRGLALGNALAAAKAGVARVHGTACGIGERCGNTPMEHLVVQLGAVGARPPPDERAVREYRELAASALAGDPAVPVEPLVPLRLAVNGQAVEIATRPSRTLLELLRYDLDLTGSKQGCDKGDCGACTVLVDGEPVLSCLTLALSCADRKVTTVEGLRGAPRLEPLIDAFDRRGAGQCGFCTPGMLMSAKALLLRDRSPTREAIREAISGNLCRCTGYGAILDAVELAAKIERGEEPSQVDFPGDRAPAPLPPYRSKGS